MSPAFSMKAWIVYVWAIGATLLLAPNVLLGLFGIPETSEVWIRVLGVVVVTLGILYWAMVQEENISGFRASVIARYFAAAGLIVLALTAGPWQLVLFGLLDFLGASWTLVTLRSDRVPAPA